MTRTAIILALSACVASAELIPADRLYPWDVGTTVGVLGGVPSRTNLIDITAAPYSADNTGATDVTVKINTAITAASSNDVVYFPAGSYQIGVIAIALKSGVTLRGAGMSNTMFLALTNNNAFNAIDLIKISDYNAGYWANQGSSPLVTAGLTNYSTNIVVSDGSGFTVGYPFQLARRASDDQTDNPFIIATWTPNDGYIWKQKFRLTAKTGNSLTFWPPLAGDCTGEEVRAQPGGYNNGMVGLEDFSILISENTKVFAAITFGGVRDCWISNVFVTGTFNYSVFFSDALNCQMTHSHLGPMRHVGSSGANLLFTASSSCLIENNLLDSEISTFENDAGSSANVFAYNFCINTGGAYSVNANHGGHNHYNLYEGNIINAFMCDGYHGSASHDTAFRNWLTGIGTGAATNELGYAYVLKRFTRQYNCVGNIIGADSPYTMTYNLVSLGDPNIGNTNFTGFGPPWVSWGGGPYTPGDSVFQEKDTNVLQTATFRVNYYYYTDTIPAGEALGGDTFPSSLYLDSNPGWFYELTYPPFNPQSVGVPNYADIPAGYFYMNGVWPSGEAPGEPGPPQGLRARIRPL